MIKTAVLGYGTVGSGVVEVLKTNAESIARRAGEEIAVQYVLDLRDFPGDPVESVLVHDYETILNDPEVRVVVETMGGLHPAYEFTKQALQAGKSVCTSNKELVAQHGVELMQVAKEHDANYLFEASCGGGIPIIHAIQGALTADVIDSVAGILNGTTNYILTKMTQEGSEFNDALSEAQANGYAERNPEADIEGGDACRKIAILSSLAYESHIHYTDIHMEGISGITAMDIKYAKALGAAVKLLAFSRKNGCEVSAMVAPCLVRSDHPLFMVNDVFNAVLIHGNMLGDAMFYGSGAGRLATASAVAADVVDCAKNLGKNIPVPKSGEVLQVLPAEEMENRFFVRVAGDVTARLPEITTIFGEVETLCGPGVDGEFGFLTETMTEAAFAERAARLEGLIGRIRVYF